MVKIYSFLLAVAFSSTILECRTIKLNSGIEVSEEALKQHIDAINKLKNDPLLSDNYRPGRKDFAWNEILPKSVIAVLAEIKSHNNNNHQITLDELYRGCFTVIFSAKKEEYDKSKATLEHIYTVLQESGIIDKDGTISKEHYDIINASVRTGLDRHLFPSGASYHAPREAISSKLYGLVAHITNYFS